MYKVTQKNLIVSRRAALCILFLLNLCITAHFIIYHLSATSLLTLKRSQLFLFCLPAPSGCAEWCSASNLEHFSFNYAWEIIVVAAGQLPLLHHAVYCVWCSLNTALIMIRINSWFSDVQFTLSFHFLETYEIWHLICKYITTSSFCWGLRPTPQAFMNL